MPKRRQLDLRDYDALLREVDRLRLGGYTRTGNWGLAEICHHLHMAYSAPMTGFTRKPRGLIQRTIGPIIFRRLLRTRRIPIRVNAPSRALPPAGLDEAQAVAQLKATIDRFRAYDGPLHDNPIFGPLTRAQWDEFNLIHAQHHLAFLQPKDQMVV